MQIKKLYTIITITFALLLTNCASYDFSRRIVKQGNLLQKDKINRLKIGMSKEDAAILMGTSLISPIFNDDRWDYAYTSRKGGNDLKVRNLVLYFKHGALVRIENKP